MRTGSLMHRVKEEGRQIAIGTGFSVFLLGGVRFVVLMNGRLQTWEVAELPEQYGLNPFEAAISFGDEQRVAGWPWMTRDEPEPPEPEPFVPPVPGPRVETQKEALRRMRREKRVRPKPIPGSGHPPLFDDL